RIESRGATTEPCPQTGDARAVSYPGLILDGDDPEPAPELLAYVVELVVQGRAAEREDGRCHVDELPVGKLLDERLVAGLLDQLGHAVHGPLELHDLPVSGPRFAVPAPALAVSCRKSRRLTCMASSPLEEWGWAGPIADDIRTGFWVRNPLPMSQSLAWARSSVGRAGALVSPDARATGAHSRAF